MPSVLVVDDQEDILQTTALVLRKGGYEVATASTGLEALSLAQALHPDLILLDIEMPRMDGRRFDCCASTTRRGRSRSPCSRSSLMCVKRCAL